MGYLGFGLILAALVAGGMGYQTGEWQGWMFCTLFAIAAAYCLWPRKR